MNIEQLLYNRGLVKAAQSTPLWEIARLMSSHGVGAVLITEGSGDNAPLVGIVTDRDIVSAQLEQAKDLSSLSAGAVMTRNVLSLTQGESVEGAIAHMCARGVRRAPVVSADGVPLGVVSTDDLLTQVSSKLSKIAGIVARQSQREATVRELREDEGV